MNKVPNTLIVGYLIALVSLLAISAVVQAVVPTLVDVANSPPSIDAVATFSSYTTRLNNTPSSSFSANNGTRNVSVQVLVSDPNGYADIQSVKVRIIKWDTLDETLFSHFGPDYLDATFEYGNGTQAVYTFSFNMSETDESRLGIESPPKFYRVKARVEDLSEVVTSGLSADENADYTYNGTLPSFGISIASLNGTLHPGDIGSWDVTITKYLPASPKDINITYEFINPLAEIIGSLNESILINNTFNRTISFGIPAAGPDGTYSIRVTLTYPEGTLQEIQPVLVVYPSEEPEGNGGDPSPLIVTGQPVDGDPQVIFVNLPDSVNVYPEETVVMVAIVKNVGNISVSKLSLEVDGVVPAGSVTPSNLTSLGKGSRGFFVMSIDVPDNLAAGRFRYTLALNTDEVKIARDYFYLDVREIQPDEPREFEILGDSIRAMDKVVNEVETEMRAKQSEGFDVSAPLALLASADARLSDAVHNLHAYLFDEGREDLAEAEKLVKKAVETEYKAILPSDSGIPDSGIPISFLALLAALLLLGILIHLTRGHRARHI